MYADRHARPGRFNAGSLATSLAITGAMIAGLIFSSPTITRGPGETRLRIENIPLPAPPPPEPPKPMPKAQAAPAQPRPTAPLPQVKLPTTADPIRFELPPVQPLPPMGTGIGTDPLPLPTSSPTIAAEPALVEPAVDPRYADALQPAYPAEERRAGREARITVRVLIGMDGRVKQIEPVGAAPDSFFQSTRRQALARWRFRPGTRGGIPVEAWRTMTVRFVLDAE